MIGRIRGVLLQKSPPFLLIEAAGLGYELEAPLSTFYDLPETGQEVILLTHFIVKEDMQALYGFLRENDRSLFRSLLKISGVGAKMALAILSGMNADEFARCVHEANVDALVKLPGIGKKTAERLLVEMRDRVDIPTGQAVGRSLSSGSHSLPPDPVTEAVAALESLGYKSQDARKMLSKIDHEGMSVEDLIRGALSQALGGKQGG